MGSLKEGISLELCLLHLDWRSRPVCSFKNEIKEKHSIDRAEGTTSEIDNVRMAVLQTDGSNAHIDQLQSCQAVKNLGLYAPSDGSTEP